MKKSGSLADGRLFMLTTNTATSPCQIRLLVVLDDKKNGYIASVENQPSIHFVQFVVRKKYGHAALLALIVCSHEPLAVLLQRVARP